MTAESGHHTSGGKVYHAQKAIMNPNHEKKKTRPYTLTTLKNGMDRAFRLTGLTSGAAYKWASLRPIVKVCWRIQGNNRR